LQLAHGSGASHVSSLLVSGGSVDVANNKLFIHYGQIGAADPIASIVSYLTDGYNANWAGGEILSSSVAAANASGSHVYAIGYADGADGQGVAPSGEIEIMPTLAGDAQLQGNVNFGDFQILASNFGKSGGWDQGNFTYGSVINFGDFQLLAGNFGANTSGLTAGEAGTLESFASAFGDRLVPNSDGIGFTLVSVPEPATAGLLAAVAMGMMARRRRRSL